MAAAARLLWEAAGQIGAKRLQPFIPELLDRLRSCGELALAPELRTLLCHASVSTIERLLAPARQSTLPRGAVTTRRGSWLTHQIPLRTFADWSDARPSFLEADLVAHCGTTTEGFYLCTLCAVDVATSWVELEAVWGKGQQHVRAAVHHVRQCLPMPLLGLDSDNGSEFINQALWGYCQQAGIPSSSEGGRTRAGGPHRRARRLAGDPRPGQVRDLLQPLRVRNPHAAREALEPRGVPPVL